tara:strand:+ start:178 stop:501 length:324 start_codon:yes stop_codon:yes gene_type:complete
MKNINKLFFIVFTLSIFFLNSCKSVKENLSIKKKDSTDEFLVEKKNPLILPPDYKDLPKPLSEENALEPKEKEVDLSKIFKNSEKKQKNSSDVNRSIEELIREKIKN